MAHKTILISALALALGTAGCERSEAPANGASATSDSADLETVRKQVEETEAGMLAAFQSKDAAKLASYYSADAVVATPGRTVKGSEAIQKAMADDLGDPAFTLSFTSERTDVAQSGDLAWTSGSYKVTYTNPQSKAVENGTGSYVTVFRKQADGTWKAVADAATPGA